MTIHFIGEIPEEGEIVYLDDTDIVSVTVEDLEDMQQVIKGDCKCCGETYKASEKRKMCMDCSVAGCKLESSQCFYQMRS